MKLRENNNSYHVNYPHDNCACSVGSPHIQKSNLIILFANVNMSKYKIAQPLTPQRASSIGDIECLAK